MDKVVHFEFPYDDKDRAAAFYSTVFGWEKHEWPEFDYTSWRTMDVDERMQPKEAGAINGGMSKRDGDMPHPMFYMAVDDIDATLEKVVLHGGEIVRGKTPLGEMGFLAWFKDSEGNILGLSEWSRPSEGTQ